MWPFSPKKVFLSPAQAEELASVLTGAYAWILGVREVGDGWADGDDIASDCGHWASKLFRWAKKAKKSVE